jgi:hypothetical protein
MEERTIFFPNRERNDQFMNRAGRCVTISQRLKAQPITESPTMRSFVVNFITIPAAFKTVRCKRRAQLWSRQASIIIDLTTVALRHGWHCPPRV